MGDVVFMAWIIDWGTLLLAQAQTPPAAGAGDSAAPPFIVQMFPFIAIFIVFYFFLLRPQSQEQKKRDQLLNSLKKNDRVVTIGGILGTVANISQDGKEITLKVDENTNAKIRVLRSGIQAKVSGEDASTEASS